MTIDTSKVANRRTLEFRTLDEILREAERLARAPHLKQLGNWNLGQVLKHLESSFHISMDGPPIQVPFYIRIFAKLYKHKILKKPFPGGIKLPAEGLKKLVFSPDVSAHDSLIALRSAIERYQTESKRSPHGFFGKLTNDEWTILHLRHAALHLSFLEPTE